MDVEVVKIIYNLQFTNYKYFLNSKIENRKLKIKSGFTLMEILIILFVVGIMISGIIPLFLNVITANKSANYYSTAYRLADSKIEELRSLPFEDIDAAAGTESAPGLPDDSEILITVNNNINGGAQTDIREVEVTINWNFKSAKSHSISTLITQGGIGR